jgi:glycosyltransferase involved in cell wall biosynthesis
MSAPILSLIVPHRNHHSTLPRLLDSILEQHFESLEVIIVDDCSDISCDTIVDAYRNKGLKIILLEHEKRIYTMHARHKGITTASGEILGFADADDILWGTDAVSKLIDIFLKERPDILHFRTARIDRDGNFAEWFLEMDPRTGKNEGEEIFYDYITSAYFQQQSPVWNKYYSRNLMSVVADSLKDSKVLRFVEDVYISLVAKFHVKKYVGSNIVGYGYTYDFNYEPQKHIEAHERAVYTWHMIQELTDYFMANGCSQKNLNALRHTLIGYLGIKVGHASLSAVSNGKTSKALDEIVNNMLERFDANTLIKVLLCGSAVNAHKILNFGDIFKHKQMGVTLQI